MSTTRPEGRSGAGLPEGAPPGGDVRGRAGPRTLLLVAGAAVLFYAAAVAFRPLNANDLFWHLATGREILATRSIPSTDPFSFAADGGPWVDHEWLWQIAAQGLYAAVAAGRGPAPDPLAGCALILFGAALVAAAFLAAVWVLARDGLPAGAIAAMGLLAAELARERMMVRPETASLLFLALVLLLLESARPGLRRALALAGIVALWANVHPAALLAPLLVLLHGLGGCFGSASGAGADGALRARRPGAWAGLLLETALAGLGTLVNPYGAALWAVPFKLSTLVKTQAFYNPEWLRPPLARFPLFHLALAATAVAAVMLVARRRRLPPGTILVALALGALGEQQMRHMGLFAVAFLFSAGPLLEGFDAGSRARALLSGRPAVLVTAGGAVLAGGLALAGGWTLPGGGAEGPAGRILEPGRFPVAACEELARSAPGLRLYNDVAFGGYLIWRFHPPGRVFIDGRNEVYPRLLARLGRIHSVGDYDDWRRLVREYGIEGSIVRYKEEKVGVLYPPARPGAPPERGYRAWSAYLFPPAEWALVWFDDTALVFMRRGGAGESWISRGEYREFNPEDREYLLERADREPDFARRLRAEAERRIADRSAPPCRRAETFLSELLARAPAPVAAVRQAGDPPAVEKPASTPGAAGEPASEPGSAPRPH